MNNSIVRLLYIISVVLTFCSFVILAVYGSANILSPPGKNLDGLKMDYVHLSNTEPRNRCGVHRTDVRVVDDLNPFVSKEEYSYWNSAKEPTGDQHLYLELLENQFNIPKLTNSKIEVYDQIDLSEIDKSEFIPMDYYLWARDVIRSAKIKMRDRVVIVSALWEGFHSYLQNLSTQDVVYICIDNEMGMMKLEELSLYFLNLKQAFSVNEGIPKYASLSNERLMLLALLEIADVYIAFGRTFIEEARLVQTPSIAVLHNTLQSRTKQATQQTLSTTVSKILNTARVDVLFHSYLDPTMGYGSSAEQMALAMDKRNVSVRYYPKKGGRTVSYSQLKSRTVELLKRTELSDIYLGYYVPHEAEVRSVHRLARKAKMSFIYTTFETTRVPSSWPAIVNAFDKLLVSCPDIKDSFENTGVTIPVDIVPLGVDTTDWPVVTRDHDGQPFRFLLIADSAWGNDRKNYPLAYKAFTSEFSEEDDVQLAIKISRMDSAFHNLEDELPSNVVVYIGRYSQKKLLQIMKASDCFVFPSHGEGFGLPPREAMSTGMPSILAGFAGLWSIADEAMNYPLEYKKIRAEGYAIWQKKNNGSDYFGEWADITVQELRAKMRQVLNDGRAAVRNKGAIGAKFIREHESYDHTGLALVQSCLLPDHYPYSAKIIKKKPTTQHSFLQKKKRKRRPLWQKNNGR
eukprot:TRINITY_DN10191_c0_g1_i1.p1 TRINITY_DN10191_c0_g1~~TRINITY_DN10191_c0_g1_i1.p1  ORF type:complete len:685 (-),score=84.19 TRINITY_DN10191_c0_g1_i1:200-2254(-)